MAQTKAQTLWMHVYLEARKAGSNRANAAARANGAALN